MNGYNSCDEKIELYNKGKLQLQPGCDAAQTLEAVITDILNQIRNETGQVSAKIVLNDPLGFALVHVRCIVFLILQSISMGNIM